MGRRSRKRGRASLRQAGTLQTCRTKASEKWLLSVKAGSLRPKRRAHRSAFAIGRGVPVQNPVHSPASLDRIAGSPYFGDLAPAGALW
jgi:hypothetical protein